MLENDLIKTLQIKKAIKLLKGIDHPFRQEILEVLHKYRECPVSFILSKVKRDQSYTSQHLAILRSTQVVNVRSNGPQKLYSINYERLQLIQILCKKLKK